MIEGHCAHVAGGARRPTTSWTRVVALLAVTVVTLAACSGSDADGDDADVPTSAELDAAIVRAEAAEAERDALAAQLDQRGEVDADALAAAESELADAEEELALVQVQLDATTDRADAAEALVAEIEQIAGQFPIALDSSLIPDDLPGSYRITFEEAYCDGFSTCGTPFAETTAEVYFTEDEFLRIGVDGILDAGLFALDGSLYGITDSFTAIAPCGETQRRARITVTMYAGSIAVLEDGRRVVNDVNASITIDAPADGPDCPSGLVFYASSLTPVG